MANPSVHKGHRERLRDRFRQTGLDSFTDVQVLELLLFYAIPQKDTNPIAHALLEQFGSLSQVLDAQAEDLKKVPGVSEQAATLLTLITDLARFYQVDTAKRVRILPTIDACGEYLQAFFYGRKVETVYLLCLDAKCKVLCCREIAEGSVNSASISVRKVVETALSANATTAVLAHNHPSGIALPSEDDLQTTQRVAAALRAVEVRLIDHIVVADSDFVSMAQSGYRFEDYLLT